MLKKLYQKLSDMSMLWKFTLTYFCLILAPTLGIGILNYMQSVNSIKEQSDQNMSQTISQIKHNAVSAIQNAENIAEEIVFSTEVPAFLNNEFSFSPKEVNYFVYNIQNKLINIKHLYPNKYYKIRIFFSNKSLSEEYDMLYSLKRIAEKSYFKEITDSTAEKVWGEPRPAEEFYDINESIRPIQNNNIIIPLYERITPVTSTNLIGVLEIDILVEKVFGNLDELRNDNGGIMVLDRKGNVLCASGENGLRELNSKAIPGLSGVKELKINGERLRIKYDTLPRTDFKIVMAVPESQLLSQVVSQRNNLVLTMIVGILVVFLITFLVTSFLLARFKLLIRMMRRIESGEFDVRIAETPKDEIGKLASNFNRMAEKLEEMLINLIDQETAHRDAEIRALQSQINPHFLFNTLEGLRMECELRQQYDLAEVLTSFGRLFRYSIKWSSSLVPLSQEIEHIKNYITVMKVRFRERINFTIEIPEELTHCPVIKMMLQPLVENCFYHAFRDKEGIWEITIRGFRQGENLCIEIRDNGSGIDEERLVKINNCLNTESDAEVNKTAEGFVGLWNVDKRIKIQFGAGYGISIKSALSVGTEIMVTLPYLK